MTPRAGGDGLFHDGLVRAWRLEHVKDVGPAPDGLLDQLGTLDDEGSLFLARRLALEQPAQALDRRAVGAELCQGCVRTLAGPLRPP
jgi:hypothetical protein